MLWKMEIMIMKFLSKYYEEFKDTGRVIILPDHLNAIQYKGYIARMRFFIGAEHMLQLLHIHNVFQQWY